jgi:hypothetical protein
MKEVACLYCSSRETSNQNIQTTNSNTYTSSLDTPLQTSHSHEELYMALKSFTFTNMFYNSMKTFSLRLGIEYANPTNTKTKRYIETYPLQEGYFHVSGFQTQFHDTLQGIQSNKAPPANFWSNDSLNYSLYPGSTFYTTFRQLLYNENNQKLSLEIDSYVLTFLTEEITDSKADCCVPTKFLIEILSDTEEIYDYLGIYRPGDPFQGYDQGKKYLEIPITSTKSSTETEEGVKLTTYTIPKITYEFSWPVYLRTVDYIDVLCDNIKAQNYASSNQTLSTKPILSRIPVLTEFGQTQTIHLQNLNYVPILQNQLNQLRIQLVNNDNLINMQKSCYLCEIGIYRLEMPDISQLKGSLDEERHVPPLLGKNLFTQDKLSYGQHVTLDSLQEKVLGKNKRSGF